MTGIARAASSPAFPSRSLLLGLRPLRGLRCLRASPHDSPGPKPPRAGVAASRYNAAMAGAAAKGRKLFSLAGLFILPCLLQSPDPAPCLTPPATAPGVSAIANGKALVDLLGALLIPVIAVLALWIAWRQLKTDRDRLRLDLFDRRHSVFRGAIAFVFHAIDKGSIALSELWKFDAATADAVFLFDEDIPAYLADLRRRAIRLYTINEEGGDVARLPPDNADALYSELKGLLDWFAQQVDDLPRHFQPYLGQGAKRSGMSSSATARFQAMRVRLRPKTGQPHA